MGKSTSRSSGNRSYIIAYDLSSDRLRRKVEKTLSTLTLLLADIEILPFDTGAAERYGEIREELERKCTSIGSLDTMIAGHARYLCYTVVTNNIKELERIEGLRLENWMDS